MGAEEGSARSWWWYSVKKKNKKKTTVNETTNKTLCPHMGGNKNCWWYYCVQKKKVEDIKKRKVMCSKFLVVIILCIDWNSKGMCWHYLMNYSRPNEYKRAVCRVSHYDPPPSECFSFFVMTFFSKSSILVICCQEVISHYHIWSKHSGLTLVGRGAFLFIFLSTSRLSSYLLVYFSTCSSRFGERFLADLFVATSWLYLCSNTLD